MSDLYPIIRQVFLEIMSPGGLRIHLRTLRRKLEDTNIPDLDVQELRSQVYLVEDLLKEASNE